MSTETPDVRLVDGSNVSEGRVEIRLGSHWGTVCHDYWGQPEAKVVCRQLGLPFGAPIAILNAFYGQGSGHIFMDDVLCVGTESSLDMCRHDGWTIHNCVHQDDAGVICADRE